MHADASNSVNVNFYYYNTLIVLHSLNLKLRDFYSSLDAMCEDLDIDKAELTDKLAGINYSYDSERNQFV